jgi:hypothetical protein
MFAYIKTMIDKNDLEDLKGYIDDIIKEKAVNKKLKTFMIKLKENPPEFLTEKELNFLEEQFDKYVDIYESFTYYWDIAESISNIKSVYRRYNSQNPLKI